jgi:hypothetical protein
LWFFIINNQIDLMSDLTGKKKKNRQNHRPKIKYHPSKLEQIVNAIYVYYDCDQSNYLKKTEFAKVLSKLVRDMGGEAPSM